MTEDPYLRDLDSAAYPHGGAELKRIAGELFAGRSLGPEFIKQWGGAVVLSPAEAELVRRAVGQIWEQDPEDTRLKNAASALLEAAA